MNDSTKLLNFGNIVNNATYRFLCQTKADLDAIEASEYNFGSGAIVLYGTDDKPELYIADKDKVWVKI